MAGQLPMQLCVCMCKGMQLNATHRAVPANESWLFWQFRFCILEERLNFIISILQPVKFI